MSCLETNIDGSAELLETQIYDKCYDDISCELIEILLSSFIRCVVVGGVFLG